AHSCSLCFFRLSRPFGQHHLAAGLLDRRDRCLRGAHDGDRDRRLDLALGEQADTVADPAQHAGGHQSLTVDRVRGSELFGVERGLQPAQVHALEVLLKDLVVKAALRQPAMQRGLAALERVDRDARAPELALAAMTRGLALARADAAPEALRAIMRARIIPD